MNVNAYSAFFSHIPIDWIIIFAFAVLVAFDAMRAGTGRACALSLSLPVTLLLISELSHAVGISSISAQFETSISKALIFGIIFVIAYFLVRRINKSYRDGGGAIIQAILTGISTASILVVIWLQVPELQSVWHFGTQVQSIFGEAYRFWWIAGSYAALAFVRS